MATDSTRENRSMSDPTPADPPAKRSGAKGRRGTAILRGNNTKEKEKEKEKMRGGGKGAGSGAVAVSKEAKREQVKRCKKDVMLLEFDSYVPPLKLVQCMKRVIAMMEKEGNTGVTRWYKKRRGRIIEACPWNRYYPSSSDSDSDSGILAPPPQNLSTLL
jgi:hypothetical protein